LTRGAGTGKAFTLKLVIQGLLRLYNRNIFSNLTKTKVLFLASTSKVAFNIDGLTIHSTLNIHVQQSLFSLPNLSSNSLNRLTCSYEQLQIVVIDEISLVGATIFNIINNRLRSIKHIQNKIFGGVDIIMIGDFYQEPLVKDSWIFQNIKDNVNALAPNVLQTH
jgi:ATP-dependent DNA helicase PIF1